jgi:hypothetical protein
MILLFELTLHMIHTLLLKVCIVIVIVDGIGISYFKREQWIGILPKPKCNLLMIPGIFLEMILLSPVQKGILYSFKKYLVYMMVPK